MSTASSKHLYLSNDIWRLYFSFSNKDDSRFYSNSNTKARASYLCYEKKTDIRGCDVYKDVVPERRRNSVEFRRCDGPCSLYLFNFSATPEHKIYIFVNIILFCLGPQIYKCGVKKTDVSQSLVCNLCTFECSIEP